MGTVVVGGGATEVGGGMDDWTNREIRARYDWGSSCMDEAHRGSCGVLGRGGAIRGGGRGHGETMEGGTGDTGSVFVWNNSITI